MANADAFPVKHIHSGMPRAPVLTGQPGALIRLLDALLVTGWGAMTPQRIEIADGIATVRCNSGDTFLQHCVIEISGAEQPELNGPARVLSSTAAGFTFATTAPDGFATGSISIKAAPAGWEKLFTGENKAVYRSTSHFDGGWCWRVDDTAAKDAYITGFVSMDDVDTGTNQFPADAGTGKFIKSSAESSDAVHYDLFADPQYTLVSIQFGRPGNARPDTGTPLLGFGTPLHLMATGDAWCAMVSGWNTDRQRYYGVPVMAGASNGGGRPVEATFLPLVVANIGNFYSERNISGNSTYMGSIAGAGRVFLSRLLVKESAQAPRAVLPGAFYVPQTGLLDVAAARDVLRASLCGSQRTFLAVAAHDVFPNANAVGLHFVDITGPWRPALGAAFDFGNGNG